MRKELTITTPGLMKNLSYAVLVAMGAMAYSAASHAACESPEWKQGTAYGMGDVVQYNGHNYQIRQAHTAWADNWTPDNVPALWTDIGVCGEVKLPKSSKASLITKKVTPPTTFIVPPSPEVLPKRNDPPIKAPGDPLTEEQFKKMFPQHNPAYNFEGLVWAASMFKKFSNTGDLTARKQEMAAFLANVGHETGDLVYIEEIAKADYCQPNAQYPCAPGKQYFGRGPLQISWNYNYGEIGKSLDLPLLTDPDMVARDPIVAWATAIWFWMTQPGAGTMTAHSAMSDGKGFGETIRSINGSLECNGRNPAQVSDRVRRYESYTSILGVSTGPGNLGC